MTIDQAFNKSVDYYDNWMKKALPGYEDLLAVARDLIPFPAHALIDVLDLGAGTGLFSRHVLDKYPQGSFVLWDIAAKMLDVARKRFGPSDGGRFRYVLDDYRRIDYTGTFDVVLSSLSIHHLSDEDKRLLFPRIYRALRSPGAFYAEKREAPPARCGAAPR